MLLMVSLDSENADWLRANMAAGNLPNLAALAKSGRMFDVDAALLPGLAYPTMYSGLRAADIGCYFPVQWESSEQRVINWERLSLPPTIFGRLEREGRRIVVLDPPELAPIRLTNGFCASGIQFRARVLLHGWSTDPARLGRVLVEIGDAPRADEVFGEVTAADLQFLRNSLLQAPARLTAAAMQVLREESPDLLWLTCCGLHVAGHQFFRVPLMPQLEATRLDLARGYDRMIGELVAKVPPGARVMITYAKGMGRVTQWSDLLPAMLRAILGEEQASAPVSQLRRLLPRSVRRWLAGTLTDHQALEIMAKLSTPKADWSRTRAFCLPTDCPGFIRMNLSGRERDGIVPDREAAGLLEQIADGLRTYSDLDGRACVASIHRPEELVGKGGQTHSFPDLIVKWQFHADGNPGGVRSPKFGEIRRTAELVGRSGNHCPGAFSILNGETVDTSDPMRIVDIPATLLSGMAVKADDLPGRSYWL